MLMTVLMAGELMLSYCLLLKDIASKTLYKNCILPVIVE